MSQDHIFSLDHALASVDDDRELLRAMIELFVEHGLQDLAAIQAAVVSQNAAALAASAHRLKGALVQFGAPAAVEAVSALEALGKAGTLEVAGRGYDKLETELFRLLAVMRHLLGKGFIE